MHKVLDVLKRHGAKATFFVTSDFVVETEKCKELMQRILAEGHELGNHCPKDIFYNKFKADNFERELLKTARVIEEIENAHKSNEPPKPPGATNNNTPVKVRACNLLPRGAKRRSAANIIATSGSNVINYSSFFLLASLIAVAFSSLQLFRPPRGLISPAMASVLKKHSYQSILTSSFSNDPFVGGDLPPSEIRNSQYDFAVNFHCDYNLKRILYKAVRGQGGDIVIFHVPNTQNRRQTIFALDQLLWRLGNVGIRAVTVNAGYQGLKDVQTISTT